MVPYSKEMNMSYVVAGTPKWVRDLGYERFRLHGDKEGPDNGQGWQILRQVSPTQSHSNLGAAEKAISTVRGTIDESGVMSKDEILSWMTAKYVPARPWTIRHAAWVLTRYKVRRDTHMTSYQKIRGQKIKKEILPLGEQARARRPGANVNQLLQP